MLETCIQFAIYAIRWQLSTPILSKVIAWGQKRGWSPNKCAFVANLIGAVIFFPVDKYITFTTTGWIRYLMGEG
jgi:hypothetical protein